MPWFKKLSELSKEKLLWSQTLLKEALKHQHFSSDIKVAVCDWIKNKRENVFMENKISEDYIWKNMKD